jgi:hypothetical protein
MRGERERNARVGKKNIPRRTAVGTMNVRLLITCCLATRAICERFFPHQLACSCSSSVPILPGKTYRCADGLSEHLDGRGGLSIGVVENWERSDLESFVMMRFDLERSCPEKRGLFRPRDCVLGLIFWVWWALRDGPEAFLMPP